MVEYTLSWLNKALMHKSFGFWSSRTPLRPQSLHASYHLWLSISCSPHCTLCISICYPKFINWIPLGIPLSLCAAAQLRTSQCTLMKWWLLLSNNFQLTSNIPTIEFFSLSIPFNVLVFFSLWMSNHCMLSSQQWWTTSTCLFPWPKDCEGAIHTQPGSPGRASFDPQCLFLWWRTLPPNWWCCHW